MTFRYRAVSNGTLSNPYRFVRKGELVVLEKPLEKPSKWLLPEEEGNDRLSKPLPVTPYIVQSTGRPRTGREHLPAPSSDAYREQMEKIKLGEAIQDGHVVLPDKKPESHVAVSPVVDGKGDKKPKPSTQDTGDAQTGTGNQDVL